MKTSHVIFLLALIGLSAIISSCKDTYTETRTYTANVPVYMSYDELRSSVAVLAPSAIETLGKIYIKDQYLFVNEKFRGIHIFDNSDPANPVNLSFINIPGNVDLTIKGNFLYADSYIDLVVFDISNVSNATEAGRLEDVFPYTIPDVEEEYPIAPIDQESGVIIAWDVQQYTETFDGDIIPRPIFYFDKVGDVWLSESSSGSGGGPSSQTVGVGGSLARSIIVGDMLYVLNQWQMQLVDISVQDQPEAKQTFSLSWMAETVFVDSTFLYIGTQTGMLIYDVSQPASPDYVAEYQHFQSCDPVVVDQGIAYVTMRSGNRCGNWENQMDVINVDDPENPELIKSYSLTEPYGLGIDNNTLFVCDGSAGLKIFDATDPTAIDQHLIKQYPEIQARDVIPFNGTLIMIGTTGIYQYNYADLNNIVEISRIEFVVGN